MTVRKHSKHLHKVIAITFASLVNTLITNASVVPTTHSPFHPNSTLQHCGAKKLPVIYVRNPHFCDDERFIKYADNSITNIPTAVAIITALTNAFSVIENTRKVNK